MEVALIGEGTYPHQFGGVSVWCDQLVRGMPDYDFLLVALTATGVEPVRWSLPENVTSVASVPLWGPPPPGPPSGRFGRRQRRAALPSALTELIELLLAPPGEAQDRFSDVLREMFEFAQKENLTASLSSESAVGLLSDLWQDWRLDSTEAAPTVHDAVMSMQLLEHSLRPFSHPPVRADVSHAVTNGLGALPALAAKWRYGTPMIVTEHGIYMREQYMHSRGGPFRWPVRALHLRFLRRLCSLGYHEAEMITPGNVYNKRWEEQLGADMSRVRTVYNGVDPADFPVIEREPDTPTISWAGRVDPVKDLETLLLAFALVHHRMPKARLRMFGAPPPGQEEYLERCRSLAEELGISEVAKFEGRVPDISDAYAAGQVVVLCSIAEGFPYTLIEAMTCGRPCVATDVGGVGEAVADTGMIVPPRSPEALADACLTLLQDASLRRKLGAAARMRALEYFTVDRAISAFDEIYTFVGAGLSLPTAEMDDESDDMMPASLAERDDETELLQALEAAG
jgi:glycosyltransferase involved in cell wall biosynthesis